MKNGKNDVRPSVENRGLVIRSQFQGDITAKQSEVEQAVQAETLKRHLTKMADYDTRDIFTATESGITVVGPAAGDSNSVCGLAHNAAMATIEAHIAALTARIAVLESGKK